MAIKSYSLVHVRLLSHLSSSIKNLISNRMGQWEEEEEVEEEEEEAAEGEEAESGLSLLQDTISLVAQGTVSFLHPFPSKVILLSRRVSRVGEMEMEGITAALAITHITTMRPQEQMELLSLMGQQVPMSCPSPNPDLMLRNISLRRWICWVLRGNPLVPLPLPSVSLCHSLYLSLSYSLSNRNSTVASEIATRIIISLTAITGGLRLLTNGGPQEQQVWLLESNQHQSVQSLSLLSSAEGRIWRRGRFG
jgi:hypothetical protein